MKKSNATQLAHNRNCACVADQRPQCHAVAVAQSFRMPRTAQSVQYRASQNAPENICGARCTAPLACHATGSSICLSTLLWCYDISARRCLSLTSSSAAFACDAVSALANPAQCPAAGPVAHRRTLLLLP